MLRAVPTILKRARLEKNLTLAEAARRLKIHPRFLEALEEGRYDVFSSPVHLKGFLKNYAQYLDLNVEEVLAFWRREYPQGEKAEKNIHNPQKPLFSSWLVFTPGSILVIITAFLVLGFFGYLLFAYRSFAEAPPLEVLRPAGDFRISSLSLDTAGRTAKEATLTINGQKVPINEKGEFSVNINLSPGINNLNYTVANNLGRERTVSRVVIVENVVIEAAGESTPAAAPALTAPLVEVKIIVGPEAVWLEVSEDEKSSFQGLLLAGLDRTFRNPKKIKIKSGNAGSTQVIVNGRDLGKLGSAGEVIEREFYP